jgi:regulatory protein
MKPCLDYAMDYIYRFPKSERELRIQLSKKWYFGNEIDYSVDQMKKKGFVDDANFATMYIESELIHKGKPSVIIYKKLLEKWIDKQILRDLMEKFETQASDGINERIKKEIERMKKLGDEWVVIIQKLMRRGYTVSQIKECLKEKD